MACVEGFRCGKRTRFAWAQSTYSVESCVSQNVRSSASVVNLGIALSALFIHTSFFAVHLPGGDRADLPPCKSQGERDVQQPSRSSLSQGMKAGLHLAMFQIRSKHEGHMKKDLLDFGLADLMFVFTLAVVACIPIEPFDLLEVDHGCIFS